MSEVKTTIVLAEVSGKNLIFRVIDSVKGMSDLYTHLNQGGLIDGNPFGVYGPEVEQWTGTSKYLQDITVCTVTSGSLIPRKLHEAKKG